LFGVAEEAAAAAGELPLAGGVAAGAGDVAALDVALMLAGAVVGGVDEAATLSAVDVAAGAAAATEVDDAASVVDVAATCARAGLTMANPIRSARTSTLAPTNTMVLFFIGLSTININNHIGFTETTLCDRDRHI